MPQTPQTAVISGAAETKVARMESPEKAEKTAKIQDFGMVVMRKPEDLEGKAQKRKIEAICKDKVREIVDLEGRFGLRNALAEGRLTQRVFDIAADADWRYDIRNLLKRDVPSEEIFEKTDLDMKCLYFISEIAGKNGSGAEQMRYLSTVKAVEGRGL